LETGSPRSRHAGKECLVNGFELCASGLLKLVNGVDWLPPALPAPKSKPGTAAPYTTPPPTKSKRAAKKVKVESNPFELPPKVLAEIKAKEKIEPLGTPHEEVIDDSEVEVLPPDDETVH
jgi:hypothetical protein